MARLEVVAVSHELRLWNRLHCLAFDDVMREVCDLRGGDGPEALAGARQLAGHFLRMLVREHDCPETAALAPDVTRLLRGSLFVRYSERVLHWMDRLPAVEAEYERRLLGMRVRLGAEQLRPYVDRGGPGT